MNRDALGAKVQAPGIPLLRMPSTVTVLHAEHLGAGMEISGAKLAFDYKPNYCMFEHWYCISSHQ